MKPCSLFLVAVSSVLVASTARAADRPHYGGVLRIQVAEAPQSLSPEAVTSEAPAGLLRLIFETLLRLDDRGQPQPLLATSWEAEPGDQRWRFRVRGGVFFSDGAPLDAAAVAASLRNSDPGWKVLASGDMVQIETGNADHNLPAELALARNAIVRKSGDRLIGTGTFTVAGWAAGRAATFKANEQYWGGRVFLDVVEVEFGKSDREQTMALDLDKADLVQVVAENIRRTQAENSTVISSAPSQLLALLFSSDPHSDDEAHARNALAASIDRAALNDVVLQGGGESTSALLPTWLSGYGFIFANPESPARAAPGQKHPQKWNLAVDSVEPAARIIAQRIALNARDVGITLDLPPSQSPDVRLVSIPLESNDAHIGLRELANALQLPAPRFENQSVAELYAAEKTLLQSQRVIPLLHLRSAVAIRPAVRGFSRSTNGAWQLENVWLAAEKP